MRLARVCAAGLLAAVAFTTGIVDASAATAASVSVKQDGTYGPVDPQAALGGAVPRVNARCKDGAATGSVPVSISFDQAGRASGWTARRDTGDLVAQGPGNVAVFGVQIDCRHPHPVVGSVYFNVTRSAKTSARTPVTTAQTTPVKFYVNVLPASSGKSQTLSAPVLTGGAAILLACLGVLGAFRRVRSLTRRSRATVG